eukprot:9116908-Pyramimonas_sp.AAC.1
MSTLSVCDSFELELRCDAFVVTAFVVTAFVVTQFIVKGNQMGELASFEVAEPVMSRLEDFFSGPEFTSMLGDFMGENASKIQLVNVEEEQPLQNHDLYCRYTVSACNFELKSAQIGNKHCEAYALRIYIHLGTISKHHCNFMRVSTRGAQAFFQRRSDHH